MSSIREVDHKDAYNAIQKAQEAIKGVQAPQASVDEAVIIQLSPEVSSVEVERHITDYFKGRGDNSKDVSGRLAKLDNKSDSLLAAIDPNLSRDYGAYQSAFTYGKKVRYISNVGEAVSSIKGIQDLISKVKN